MTTEIKALLLIKLSIPNTDSQIVFIKLSSKLVAKHGYLDTSSAITILMLICDKVLTIF